LIALFVCVNSNRYSMRANGGNANLLRWSYSLLFFLTNLPRARAHVFSDIKPYFCLYEDCHTGEQSYGSPENWIEHLLLHQQPNRTHYISTLSICPLCHFDFDPAAGKGIERRYRHIRQHMESVGLHSLPPALLGPEPHEAQLEQYISSDDIEASNSHAGLNTANQTTNSFEDQLKALPNLTGYDQIIDHWFSLLQDSSRSTGSSGEGEEVNRVANTDQYQNGGASERNNAVLGYGDNPIPSLVGFPTPQYVPRTHSDGI